MALRGTEQFSFILTSDGSMDIYPDNKTSSFQILLKKPLELGDEDWEIALMSINYPYSWTNVGPSAKVYMRYYIDSKSGPQVMNFPNWQCQSMQEVIDFMTEEMNLKSVDADSSIFFGLDELGRFKVSTSSPTCDIGFSNNLLKLLGLGGHPQVQYMTISAFDERQAQRHMLDRIWHEDNLFDFGDEDLKNKILYCEDLIECSRILSPFINYEKIADFFEMLEITGKISPSIEGRGLWEWNGEKDLIVAIYDPGLDVQDFAKSKQGQGMALIISYMKKLIDNMRIPHSFKGVTPGILNPIQRMFIYMNIVEPIDMNDKYVKLLKMVNTRGQSFETTQEDFQTPTYLPLRKGDISWIEVLIANETGEPVSFQTGTVVLTLHFRKAARARFSKRF